MRIPGRTLEGPVIALHDVCAQRKPVKDKKRNCVMSFAPVDLPESELAPVRASCGGYCFLCGQLSPDALAYKVVTQW